MRIAFIDIQNFRRLYRCRIDFSKDTTLFVGANNSGKTSAMDVLAKFLKDNPPSPFSINDFTLTNLYAINQIGNKWVEPTCEKPDSVLEWRDFLPSIDVWLDVDTDNIHHVVDLIPTLKWRGGLLGVRLIYQPKNIEALFNDYRNAYKAARETEQSGEGKKHTTLFPKNLCDFIDRHINSKKQANSIFTIKSYLLDPECAMDELPQKTDFDMQCLSDNPLKAIIRVDMIPAQRGLSDEVDHTQLSSQMRGYYDKHLNPEKNPTPEDLEVLEVTESSRIAFDKSLESKFRPAIRELEGLGYPGVENPQITIASKISAKDTLRHDSAVQYSLGDKLMLPEKYNGLGYQNLISVVFDLISFRDGWMRKGKASSSPEAIEPLHLILV